MESKWKITIIILILAIVICLLIFYSFSTTKPTTSDKLGVVVTVTPQMEFVKAVGGDKVDVTVMVPAGADPHTYEPLPSQMQQVSQAQLYLQVGSPLEFELTWMDKIKALNSQLKMFNTSKGIEFIPNYAEGEEGNDPHVWVSPKNAKIMVENTYQALVEVDPQNQKYYQENRDLYIKNLDELDRNLTQSLAGAKNRKIMVYHPAWGYLSRDYGLEQISIEKEGKEPTPQDLSRLIAEAQANNIKIIFVSPQHNQRNAQVIASEIGGQLVVVDPLAQNYLENMQKVAAAFSQI
ncbi:MAG: zinc ABC transporter substrate-binding protein [Methanobacteriales archaeon Met13]